MAKAQAGKASHGSSRKKKTVAERRGKLAARRAADRTADGTAAPPPFAVSPRGLGGAPSPTEPIMAEIGRILSEQEFESIDEANAILQGLLETGAIDNLRLVRTPLDEAQDLVYEAWESSPRRRIALARQALALSPDCADALNILAEAERSPEARRRYYEEAVRAGERAIGAEAFEELTGHFWGVLETRPYMRARAGLATCLWELGEREAANAH